MGGGGQLHHQILPCGTLRGQSQIHIDFEGLKELT